MEKEFDQEAWNLKIREASAKWFKENPDIKWSDGHVCTPKPLNK